MKKSHESFETPKGFVLRRMGSFVFEPPPPPSYILRKPPKMSFFLQRENFFGIF